MGKKTKEEAAPSEKPAPAATENKQAPAAAPVEQKTAPVAETKPAAVAEKSPPKPDVQEPATETVIKAVLDQGTVIKNILDILSFIIDEIEFKFDNLGLHFRAIDSSHVAAIFADLTTNMFTEFKATGPASFTINASDIVKVFRRFKASDLVSIGFTSREKCNFSLGTSSEKSKRTFKLRVKDPVFGESKNDIEGFVRSFKDLLAEKIQVSFQIDMKSLEELIKDVSITSDLLTLASDLAQRNVKVSAVDESGGYESILPETSLSNLDIKGDATGIYSINFLEQITRMANVCENVKISFFNPSPVFLEFQLLGSNGQPGGVLYYMLAPRVEDQGDDDIFDSEEEEGIEVPEESGDDDESGNDES